MRCHALAHARAADTSHPTYPLPHVFSINVWSLQKSQACWIGLVSGRDLLLSIALPADPKQIAGLTDQIDRI